MDGSDRKDAERKELKSDEGLGYFESLMRDRSKALDDSMLSFTEDVRKTMEYEADYSKMTQRYGARDHFIDVLKSDDDSVTLRFNFSRYDSEGKRTEAINKGVVYTMPWRGADSVSLGQKARFLSFWKNVLQLTGICRTGSVRIICPVSMMGSWLIRILTRS